MNQEPQAASMPTLLSMRKLEFLLGFDRLFIRDVAQRAGRYYDSFDLQFKGTTKWRHIDNPTGDLRVIQKRIQDKILKGYTFPDTMLGGVKKGSIFENARRHMRQKYVFAIDIRNCFPSIRHASVFSTYRDKLECSSEIAGLLTQLTTYQDRLPQGAPTSSLLANLVLLNIHDEVKAICEKCGLNFTFYVDDIVLSGDAVEDAIEPVIVALQKHGWSIACKKKKLMRQEGLQKVTGLVVNRKPNIAKEYIEKVRREICKAKEKGFFTENEENSFLGRISYIESVNEGAGRRVRSLFDSFDLSVIGRGDFNKCNRRPCRHAKRHIHSR